MLARWRERRQLKETAHTHFLEALEASRDPHLYAACGVADTVDGRFEMLCLHVILRTHALQRRAGGADLARAVNEAFVTAMDDMMREVGIGDLSVPRRVKKAAGALYDRHAVYAPALAAEGEAAEPAWRAAFEMLRTQSGLEQVSIDPLLRAVQAAQRAWA
jgi:cytochrome b pre-mRNA-processing protein 3